MLVPSVLPISLTRAAKTLRIVTAVRAVLVVVVVVFMFVVELITKANIVLFSLFYHYFVKKAKKVLNKLWSVAQT